MGASQANAGLVLERNVEAGREDRPAYVTSEETLSYGALLLRANQMGNLLRQLGVRREERVLLVLDDTTAFPVAFLGALRIGAVPVPVSVRETAENFAHFVDDSYAEVVVCDAAMLPRLQQAMPGRRLRYLARGGAEGAIDLADALDEQAQELTPVARHPDDMAFWLYTSGSTGRPKGVVHVHKTIAATCEAFGRGVLALSEEDRIFSTTKLYHAYGLGNSFSYPLHFGASAVLLEGPPTPERLLDAVRRHRPTVYCSVPALYKQVAADPSAEDGFGAVRICISAAEPLPVRTFERWLERFGLEIYDGIGATEMIVSFCSNRPGDVAAGTLGRPIPGYELRLLDEHGAELHGPGVGSLEVRGESRAALYWHQQARTRSTMRGEWYVTGDRLERREDGRYVYLGRTDDMLKVGGLWVSPIDIEQVLLEHPAVVGAGVVAANIDDYTRLAAFVECGPGVSADEQLRETLRSVCRQRLRDHEYPHLVRFVDELPRTHNGKPQRFRLRETIERELATIASPPLGANGASAPARSPDSGGDLTGPDRDRAALELVRHETAALLGEPSGDSIDPARTFTQLGFDSLTAVELRNRLADATGLALSSTLIFDYPTPRSAAGALLAQLDGVEPPAPDRAAAADLAESLRALRRRPPRVRTPPAPLPIRLKTSALFRAALPGRIAVERAERHAELIWRDSEIERRDATRAVETIVAGTAREGELHELARLHLIESTVDRALFWERPWRARTDETATRRLRAALSGERGVLLSACHLGPYYRLDRAAPFRRRTTYLVPGPWFFEQPSPDYWGRRLARWRNGTSSRPVRATGSFLLIEELLRRGEAVFLFFDQPGPRQTRFLGKPAMLADGTALLSMRADALVLPLRSRRVGSEAWVDVGETLDPRAFAGVDALHEALAELHEAWILENPAAMEDPRSIGWRDGASREAWVGPPRDPDARPGRSTAQKSGAAGTPT
ncbi:MAG: benzoate-CoA ligase family protein [Solirubrobacteraceae bacterium]